MAVAVVTDVGGDIGLAVVRRLQADGMKVAVLGREARGGDVALHLDVTDRGQMQSAAERVTRELGPPSVLVIAPQARASLPFGSMPTGQWQSLLDDYLGGTASACAAFVPGMVQARRGCVITLVPSAAVEGVPGEAYPAAASGTILGFTKSFALEVARHGVRVNCIAAGAVSPDEIADTIAFLVADGDFFVGQVLTPHPDPPPQGGREINALPAQGGRQINALPVQEGREISRPVCLVTGAAQGIGATTVARLAKEGGRVAVNGRLDDDRLAAVVRATGGLSAPGDIADPAAVRRMVGDIERQLGSIEVLVCNAARMTMKPFLEQEPEEWWEQIRINLSGHLDLISSVLPGMRRLGRGRIVIIASLWGITGWENATGYAASKSALIALTRSLGRELAPEGIYVTAVAPGIIDTPQLQVDADDAGLSLDEMRQVYARQIPVGRIGKPDDVAATIAFLSTNGARAFAGQLLQPNGGELRATL
jgi:2-hydroxycyclohexanecarboxyl-CoA dehydrogenase